VCWWFGHSKDETVKDAIDLLTQNKIISAPVYDDDANQYHTNTCHSAVGCSASHHLELLMLLLVHPSRFIGFVDMLDLATLCVEHLSTAVSALLSASSLVDKFNWTTSTAGEAAHPGGVRTSAHLLCHRSLGAATGDHCWQHRPKFVVFLLLMCGAGT
jgi:hypothetical protein